MTVNTAKCRSSEIEIQTDPHRKVLLTDHKIFRAYFPEEKYSWTQSMT